MLRELEIKNILLIKRLSLNFSSGLNAFTGETGTGKSILLDCLGFVLGARGQASIVRDGTDRGEVTAIFSLESYSKVNLILDEAGIKQSDELIIRRVNFLDGRKSAWINDKRVSSEFLRNLGENLIEIHTHGNPTIVQTLIGVLLEKGVRLAKAGEFTKTAYINKKIDLIQAEAVYNLINSQTTKAINISLDNLEGKLSNEFSFLCE